MKSHEKNERLATYCKALSHPTRVVILQKLIEIDRCTCGSIVADLPLAQSTVSGHLKILKEAGLVRGEVEGPKTCYCVNPDALDDFRSLAASMGGRK